MYHMMRLTILKSLAHVHAHKRSPHWEDILTQIKLANVFIEFLFILLHDYSILLCMYIANICSYIASCIFVTVYAKTVPIGTTIEIHFMA